MSLIQILAEEGIVGSHERDRLLVSLAERHYYVVEVSPEMLIEALAPGRPLQTVRDVFSLLAAPTMNVDTAATTLVRGVKRSSPNSPVKAPRRWCPPREHYATASSLAGTAIAARSCCNCFTSATVIGIPRQCLDAVIKVA